MLPETSHPLFPATPSKSWSPVKPPHFLKIRLEAQPNLQKVESGGGGVNAMYIHFKFTLTLYFYTI